MFKEKSFGAAPPFLQLDDSESETEKEATAPEQKHTDPTPVEPKVEPMDDTKVVNNTESLKTEIKAERSAAIKLEKSKCDDASDISSDDEILLKASGSPKPKRLKTTAAGDDDRMSLSSFSSTEDKVEVKNIKIEADTATTSNSAMPPLPNPTDYYYGTAGGSHPSYYPNGAYDPYNNQYMAPGYMQQYVAGLSALIPGTYNMPAESLEPGGRDASTSHTTDAKKNPNEVKVSAVIDRVIDELKQILKKDFNKRMIEIIAYKRFEAWWDEQANRDKNKSSTDIETTPKIKTPVKVPDINQVINSSNSRENSYNGLGLGFRTQILKLPRFQRIRKPPSPVKDEDSKKGLSDQEDIIQDSDSEVVLDAPKSTSTFNEKLKENESKMDRKRKSGSVSSFFTSSDEENSSSAESDSELDTSSLSDMDDFESKRKIFVIFNDFS